MNMALIGELFLSFYAYFPFLCLLFTNTKNARVFFENKQKEEFYKEKKEKLFVLEPYIPNSCNFITALF